MTKFTLPKTASILALVVAIASALTDPVAVPWLTTLLGVNATTKLAALCSIIAALSHSLQGAGGEPVKETTVTVTEKGDAP